MIYLLTNSQRLKQSLFLDTACGAGAFSLAIGIYTHLIEFESDEWIVRRPKDSKEEDALIEAGFEFVRFDERDNCPIYRKRG